MAKIHLIGHVSTTMENHAIASCGKYVSYLIIKGELNSRFGTMHKVTCLHCQKKHNDYINKGQCINPLFH